MDLQVDDYKINNLSKINILLGKNGVGKSTLLRRFQGAYQNNDVQQRLTTSYITPERGGVLHYEAGVEHNMRNNPRWMPTERRKNQTQNFRQQTVAQFRDLESVVSQEIEALIESDEAPEKAILFSRYVEKINGLLEHIEIRRDKKVFSIYKKGTDDAIEASSISSGESELIALAIETLVFLKEEDFDRPKVLLLDEPDVHLHPDLQVKLMRFLYDIATEGDFSVVIATHSTAVLGALENLEKVNIAFIVAGQREIDFEEIKTTYKRFLPVFGAHPLSNIFNEAPVLLVEGEDDERIWQTAVRSSNGVIQIYPCSCGGTPNIPEFEDDIIKVANAVYDNAKAYSLRDRDDADENDLDDKDIVTRLRLKCRAAENLILADETLSSMEVGDWTTLRDRLNAWIDSNPTNPHLDRVITFRDGGYDRKSFDLKEIRNILVMQAGETKPWEVVVGRTLSNMSWNAETDFNKEHSIYNYLGEKLVKSLLPQQ